MITEHMTLQSMSDARIWAGQMNLDDQQQERLATWIWKNKPHYKCTLSEHPLDTLSDEQFWAICDGE